MNQDMNEVTALRLQLKDILGDRSEKYFDVLKKWFRMKLSKEQFDFSCRRLLPADMYWMHNRFLLALLNRCQTLVDRENHCHSTPLLLAMPSLSVSPSGRDRGVRGDQERGARKKARTRDRGAFEPVDVVEFVLPSPTAPPPPPTPAQQPSPPAAVTPICLPYDAFLPDSATLMGRFLLTGWDHGLEGAEDSAAHCLSVALQHFLKNVLVAVFQQRSGFRVRDGRFIYGMGSSVPNPFLKNTVRLNRMLSQSRVVAGCEQLARPSPEVAEQRAAYEVACATSGQRGQRTSSIHQPVSLFDLHEALKLIMSDNRHLLSRFMEMRLAPGGRRGVFRRLRRHHLHGRHGVPRFFNSDSDDEFMDHLFDFTHYLTHTTSELTTEKGEMATQKACCLSPEVLTYERDVESFAKHLKNRLKPEDASKFVQNMKSVNSGHFVFHPLEMEVASLYPRPRTPRPPPANHMCFAPRHEVESTSNTMTFMLELDLKPGHSFLNLGSGTGYINTLAGVVIGPRGVNHGVELNSAMVAYAEERQRAFRGRCGKLQDFDYCEPTFILGDALNLRTPAAQQYDRILCRGSIPSQVDPKNVLLALLKPGGVAVYLHSHHQIHVYLKHPYAPAAEHEPAGSTSYIMDTPEFQLRLVRVERYVSNLHLLMGRQEHPTVLPDVTPPSLQMLTRATIRESVRNARDPRLLVPFPPPTSRPRSKKRATDPPSKEPKKPKCPPGSSRSADEAEKLMSAPSGGSTSHSADEAEKLTCPPSGFSHSAADEVDRLLNCPSGGSADEAEKMMCLEAMVNYELDKAGRLPFDESAEWIQTGIVPDEVAAVIWPELNFKTISGDTTTTGNKDPETPGTSTESENHSNASESRGTTEGATTSSVTENGTEEGACGGGGEGPSTSSTSTGKSSVVTRSQRRSTSEGGGVDGAAPAAETHRCGLRPRAGRPPPRRSRVQRAHLSSEDSDSDNEHMSVEAQERRAYRQALEIEMEHRRENEVRRLRILHSGHDVHFCERCNESLTPVVPHIPPPYEPDRKFPPGTLNGKINKLRLPNDLLRFLKYRNNLVD